MKKNNSNRTLCMIILLLSISLAVTLVMLFRSYNKTVIIGEAVGGIKEGEEGKVTAYDLIPKETPEEKVDRVTKRLKATIDQYYKANGVYGLYIEEEIRTEDIAYTLAAAEIQSDADAMMVAKGMAERYAYLKEDLPEASGYIPSNVKRGIELCERMIEDKYFHYDRLAIVAARLMGYSPKVTNEQAAVLFEFVSKDKKLIFPALPQDLPLWAIEEAISYGLIPAAGEKWWTIADLTTEEYCKRLGLSEEQTIKFKVEEEFNTKRAEERYEDWKKNSIAQ